MPISEKSFLEAAKLIGCEVATIKAVTEIESRGSGFLPTGEPVILFEPHIFWKQLIIAKINPKQFSKEYSDVLYQRWGAKPYGKYSEQHPKLQKACKINREAALKSASWGAFQIMGFNHALCGCPTIQDFINKIYKNEDEHLKLFVQLIKARKLDKHLINKDWTSFARGYNGAGFAKNNYHNKLAAAYNKHK